MISDFKIVESSLMNDGVDGGLHVIACPESLSIHPNDMNKKIAGISNLSMEAFALAHKKQEEMKMEQQEISLNKKYTYRNGEPARILCVDGGDKSYPVIAITIEGQTSRHTKSGNLWDVEGEHLYGKKI